MRAGPHNPGLHWWVIGILLALSANALIAFLLFIPQTRLLEKVNKQKKFIQEQFERVQETPELLKELHKEIDEGYRIVDALGGSFGGSPEELLVRAGAEASQSIPVTIVEFSRLLAPEIESPTSRAEPWKLRCSGGFRSLVLFLDKLENAGLIPYGSGFSMEATAESGLQMSVLLDVSSPSYRSLKTSPTDSSEEK